MPNDIHYWLAAIYLHQLQPQQFLQLLKLFPNIEALFKASKEEWQAANISEKYWQLIQAIDWEKVNKDLEWCYTHQIHILTFDDERYPSQLKEIADAPLILFVSGNITALNRQQIAIVGSRHATASGINNAQKFAGALAESNLVITSGLALGIDAAAHTGALSKNGMTIGVAGTGLKHIYPKSHRALFEKILKEDGAIISEFLPDTPPFQMNFPRRNRIIAGLALGVLVVEAALKSGSLITARLATECGREVFAIPGSIHNSLARGCHHLIRQGAKLVENVADILEEFGQYPLSPANVEKISNQNKHLTLKQKQMLKYIKYEMTPIDMILLRSGLTAGEVSSILLTLELQGHIESVPGGYIRVQ